MSRSRNPSFFDGAASEEEIFHLFHLPLPRTQLESAFSFATLSSMFIGAVMVAVLYVSFLLQSIVSSALLLIATFFLTISVYSLNKVTDLEEDLVNLPDRARFVKKNRDYLLFASLESINIAVLLVFFTNPYAIPVILFPFYVGLFYSTGMRRLRIKDALLLKNIMVALAATTAAVLLPLAVHTSIPFIVLLVAYFIFLKCFINTVLFDVRDIEGDRKAGVLTIPVSLGTKKTRNAIAAIELHACCVGGIRYLSGSFLPIPNRSDSKRALWILVHLALYEGGR